MTPEGVHAIADRVGVPWDDDESFMDRCELLTGKRHLDDMDEEQLQEVADDLEMRKQAAELTKLAQAIPAEVLQAAQDDPAIEGTVLKAGGAYRAPIYDGDDVVGFFTPREEGGTWRLGPIFVMPEHRGKSLAISAVREFMDGRPGRAEIDGDNEASQKLFEAAGFTKGDGDEWVKEASYREGGSFTHDGTEYDLDAALAAADGLPIINLPVEQLNWVLDHDTPDPARQAAADLNAPVLVAPDASGRPTVVDGLHRLARAEEEGRTHLPSRVLPSDQLGQAKMGSAIWPAFDDELRKLGAATHIEKRLKARAPGVDAGVIPAIEAAANARSLDKKRTYHAPLKGGAYAVLAPVGRGAARKHVVKTVLSPSMKPPGTMLRGLPMSTPSASDGMGAWKDLKSSNLDSTRYDAGDKVLEVKFKGGGHYGYDDVPATKARGLRRARSAGKYFHKHIRGEYDHTKIALAGFGDELKKLGFAAKVLPVLRDLAGLGLVAAGTGDLYKSRGLSDAQRVVADAIAGGEHDHVDVASYLASSDPAVTAVDTDEKVVQLLEDEYGGSWRKRALEPFFKELVRGQETASAMRGDSGEYILGAGSMPRAIVDHELGHLRDFREKGILTTDAPRLGEYVGGPLDNLLQAVSKERFRKGRLEAEAEAWRLAPDSEHKEELQAAGLDSYEKAFHKDRGVLALLAAVPTLASRFIKKSAADPFWSAFRDELGEDGFIPAAVCRITSTLSMEPR